jgi:hypothetical protein
MTDSASAGRPEGGDAIRATHPKVTGPDATNVPYATPSGEGTSGWLPPDPSRSPSGPPGWIPPPAGRNLRWIGCLFALLILAPPLVFVYLHDATGPGGPNLVSVGFGTGGSECTLTGTAENYVVGTPVRIVVTFSPGLPAGATVTITTMREGAERVSSRETVVVDATDTCVAGTLPELEVGRHVVRVDFDPSSMPPLEDEIEITPE